MHNKKLSILMLIVFLAGVLPAYQPVEAQSENTTVEIQPEPSNVWDTTIMSGEPWGRPTELFVGEQVDATNIARSLILFDVSGLPYDMNVISASITLTVKADYAANGCNLQLFAILKDFAEPDARWAKYDYYTDWQMPGAEGEEDISVQIGAGTIDNGNLVAGDTVTIQLTEASMVEEMRRDNYSGFLIRCEEELDDMYEFYSSDNAPTAAMRPKLTVTYAPDGNGLDRTAWLCLEGFDYSYCDPAPLSQFPNYNYTGQETRPMGIGSNLNTVKIQCDPFPRCVNDYDVHYHISWQLEWFGSNSTITPNFWFTIPFGAPGMLLRSVPLNETTIDCGTNMDEGFCVGTFDGSIPAEYFPRFYFNDFNLALSANIDAHATLLTSYVLDYTIFYSLEPFDQNCDDTWYTPLPETYTIDPTLETPLGITGTPADHQIYPTEVGQVYKVFVEGSWLDGSDPELKNDTEVSFDGVTWMNWKTFQAYALCIGVEPTRAEDLDYRLIYFEAQTETFYIRADDGNDNYADNIQYNQDNFRYTIGLAFAVNQAAVCESSFTYDPAYDNIASVQVPGTSDDVPVVTTEPFEAGAWYGIQVASGTWQDSYNGAQRTDMEFNFVPVTEWLDLTPGSEFVYCVSSDGLTVFVQAPSDPDLSLHLRVNEENANFANNLGTLGVNIFKVTFSHTPSECELNYDLSELASSGTVAGNAANGKPWGVSTTLDVGNSPFPINTDYVISEGYPLEPGAYYMLETTGGPWVYSRLHSEGSTSSHGQSYEVQVRTDDGEWGTLEDFELSLCVVTIDALGHQRMYIQAPANPGHEYSIRAAGASAFATGEIGWNLYQAFNMSSTSPEDCSDFVYDPENKSASGTVDSSRESGNDIIFNSAAFNSDYYAILIESANEASDAPYFAKSGWYENEEADESDDLEFTTDGSTWAALPNAPGVLCYYYTPVSNELVIFVRLPENMTGYAYKFRAASETFSDNIGMEYYSVYPAAGHEDPWNTCANDYTASVPALNEYESIQPQDEEGEMIIPTLTYTEENDPDGDGIIQWGQPGLSPDHTYMVQTLEGPWFDGTHPESLYTAQLSSDGGVTWFNFSAHPSVVCYTIDQMGWYEKAFFDVVVGEQWKIRVRDTETDVFTDNTGHLAYRLSLVNEFPVEGPGDFVTDYDPEAFDVCSQSLVRPQSLSLSEIGSLGNYFGDWIQYINRSVLSYFAWCDRHSDLLISAMESLERKEPLATVAELDSMFKSITAEVDSYDWEGGGYEDTSIFTGNANVVIEQVLPEGGDASDPWDGGDLVNFNTSSSLPSYFYTCENVFSEYLPERLRTGVCFASSYWKETGASFWVQISLDVSAIFAMILMLKGAVQSLVYMMTGVRPWTKDGAVKLIGNIGAGDATRDSELSRTLEAIQRQYEDRERRKLR